MLIRLIEKNRIPVGTTINSTIAFVISYLDAQDLLLNFCSNKQTLVYCNTDMLFDIVLRVHFMKNYI